MSEIPDNTDLEYRLCRYLDGELAGEERTAMETLLAERPDLRRELERYRALDERLTGLSDELPGERELLAQRGEIFAALERKALLGERRVRLWARPSVRVFASAMAAAAAVVVAVALWRFLTPGVEDRSTVDVTILPPAAAPDGTIDVHLAPHATDWAAATLVEPVDPSVAQPPPGTVMVSFGWDENGDKNDAGMFPMMMGF
ncbi:MAG TPA: hypothetical protein DCX07_13235 [Phycisphaerales bacterium]|nr:hypothetical protein [Phycisphaerales bacterium]